MPCRELLDRVAEAYVHGDRRELKEFYVEDALICSAAEPDIPRSREEFFERTDLLQRTQLIGSLDLIPIDATAGLISATARSLGQDGGYRATQRVWLLTFKDGLVYRQRICATRQEAQEIYARDGLELGMRGAAR